MQSRRVCVCVCVCVCSYWCACVYICTDMLDMYLYVCFCVYAHGCAYGCICMFAYVYLFTCILMCLCIWMHLYVYLYVCICISMCTWVSMYLYTCTYLYMCIYLYVFVYMCVLKCACMSHQVQKFPSMDHGWREDSHVQNRGGWMDTQALETNGLCTFLQGIKREPVGWRQRAHYTWAIMVVFELRQISSFPFPHQHNAGVE
jgi:hypothetical protein